ncbi:MAG TPA: tetratricopeptide repeat protein, partial [Rhodothermales bacterium]|nr:tetratricopeptide repeat protein [Rhodothermales bacterium]
VAYAHRNLVVHRDLKPSNVFVADAGDGGLTVKLLDFGLARLLDDPDDDVLSVTGTRTATPAYAAPEQLNAGAMTTQTDVFALGAMLYELLTGTRAFPDARRDPDAPPSRPSAALPSPDAAAARATTPDRLRRRLRGDLDAIVERALRAEPAQRYASPDALADDLRRHLDGLPVRARRGTRRYRATRFVRRHRLGVGLSAVFLVMLVAAAVVFRAQARQTAQERDKAEAVAAFLEDLFLEVDVGGGRGSALTVREALDEGARRIPALADAPAVQAHLLDVMARVYRSLALYPRADSLHRRAVATYRRALGPRHPETLKAQHHYAYLLYSAGRYDEAERLYRAVLAERRRQRDPAAVFESLGDLATLLQIQHRNDEAEPLLREAVVLLDRHGRRITETPVKLVESRASLAVSLGILALGDGRAEEAATRFREGRDAYADLHGTEHVYAALAETWLARALLTLGRLDDAGRTAAHAEAVMLRQQGPRHPWRASALLVRGRVAWRQQRTAEAEALVAEATGILERTYGPRSDAAAPARAFLDSLRRVPAR